MASVILPDLFVNDPSDPSQPYRWYLSTEGLTASPERPTEVRRYAFGRFRAITRRRSQQHLDVSLEAVDRETVHQVEAWEGVTLLVRDPTGRRFFAVYTGPTINEYGNGSGLADVSLTFVEVTVSEGV